MKQNKKLILGKKPLTLEELYDVAYHGAKVILSEDAKKRIQKSRKFLLSKVKTGETIYGVNTGFGLLSNVRIKDDDIEALQYNLLRSHAVGVGDFIDDAYVKAMLLLRASTLTQGYSGVSLELVEQILAVLNAGICPLIPAQGSVGASGDLAPLSHLALVLIGEGRARYKGKVIRGKEALSKAGLKPIRLGPKEGLALINGTQFMTAIGGLTLIEAERLALVADHAGALTLEAMRGTVSAFDAKIQEVRPHPGQAIAAENMRRFLNNGKSGIAQSHENCGKVQDPYSLRCIPQVHGASRDVLKFVRDVLVREINSVTDNPLVFADSGEVMSGGNFHGQIVAFAMDALCMAVSELASISEQRIDKLTNPALSDLPAFMTKKSGLNSGFMIVQVAAAAIVSENKTLCHPASVDSLPTSADKEDHVSMGAWAARKAAMVVTNSRRVLAMELISACQGIDLLRPLKTTKYLENIHQQIRKKVPFMDDDRSLHEDIGYVEQMIREGDLWHA